MSAAMEFCDICDMLWNRADDKKRQEVIDLISRREKVGAVQSGKCPICYDKSMQE